MNILRAKPTLKVCISVLVIIGLVFQWHYHTMQIIVHISVLDIQYIIHEVLDIYRVH